MPTTPPAKRAALRRRLLAWYDAHRRDLPWRAAADAHGPAAAYAVLVSEAMLQQTQVATVLPYYHRFLAALPTVAALAAADEQQVLRLWQGLGYYRRARALHAAARAVVQHHGGAVPGTVEQLRTLPGVGRYTAGAVASIAFGARAPLVDGNVARVLARWFALDAPLAAPATRARLWTLADELVPRQRPGDFNQALMELGATVCTPRTPRCLLCPVAPLCQAHRRGVTERLPVTRPRRSPTAVEHHVLALTRRGTFLFVRRPATGLWSNMWQLPTCESLTGTLPDWARQALQLTVGPLTPLARFRHQTTHRTITFVAWRGSVTGRPQRPAPSQTWRTLDNLDDLPLPNPQRRIITDLRTPPPPP